jgi:taurine dioxygenase
VAQIDIRPLQDDLPFGARIRGVTRAALKDRNVRKLLVDVLYDKAVLVCEGMENSQELQIELSNVFGPLKAHPVKTQEHVDEKLLPGVIELAANGSGYATVEIDGEPLTSWYPWHFDHCYNDKLNLAGVLRPVVIAPDKGLTKFADGIQMFNDFPADLRKKVEGLNILYFLNPLFEYMKFGLPSHFRELTPQGREVLEFSKNMSRAIHPAVWTRKTGEKVLHIAPFMMFGIEGQETLAGDALLAEIWDTMLKTMRPYTHKWSPDDMLIWDNTRVIHYAQGCDPKYARVMHRTTIEGDYGFGKWESKSKLEKTDVYAM